MFIQWLEKIADEIRARRANGTLLALDGVL